MALFAKHKVWEIVGGAETGGVLVRSGPNLSSVKVPERLSYKALVCELGLLNDELGGQRLNYEKLTGTGPQTGWISVALNHKTLAIRVERRAPPEAPLPVDPVDKGLDISGRWTISMVIGFGVYHFMFQHQPGSETFTGRSLDSGDPIDGGCIHSGFVEWRTGPFFLKGKLVDSGQRLAELNSWNISDGAHCGLFNGTWDPGKLRFLVDNSQLQAGNPGLQYRISKCLEHCDHKLLAQWGTEVKGFDQGDGWVKVVDRYLPKMIDGKVVLRDPSEPVPSPQPPQPTQQSAPRKKVLARAVRRTPKDLLSPPEHLMGSAISSPSKLTRAQAVALQGELAWAFSKEAFQRGLHSAWNAALGNEKEQAEAQRKLCAKAQGAAVAKLKLANAHTKSEGICLRELLQTITSDSELCCNALLLRWLLEPELQALVKSSSSGSTGQAGGQAGSKVKGTGGAIGEGSGYIVYATDSTDEAAIRGIGRCRATFAQAHQDIYRPFYSGMLHAEWTGALGRASVEQYLEEGNIVLHAQQAGSKEVVGYITCRCENLAGGSDSKEAGEPGSVQTRAMISHIGVLPSHQGRGVGRRLFEELLEHLKQIAPEAARDLWINVVELNTRAVCWYRRLGFSVVSLWSRRFTTKQDSAPVVFLTMRRRKGSSIRLDKECMFGRDLCGTRVVVFHRSAPLAFLELAARRRWPWLCATAVSRYESDTDMFILQDGRRVDLNLEFALGRVHFEKPLHTILSKISA